MIELALVKQHLRIDHDYDDALLGSYIGAALSAFESFTNRTLVADAGSLPDPVGRSLVISDSVVHGALMLIGTWYENRESTIVGVSISTVPTATDSLWKPHRWVNV